ncbi:MAG: hypothetical protein KGL39_42230 [Patescibacteria group bacterium]|nr:hypothetical protein [Patescibacteria group bacterium]
MRRTTTKAVAACAVVLAVAGCGYISYEGNQACAHHGGLWYAYRVAQAGEGPVVRVECKDGYSQLVGE